jgi:hypothetical protein
LQWLVYILEDVEYKILVVPYHVRNIGVFSLLKRTKCSTSTTCPIYTPKKTLAMHMRRNETNHDVAARMGSK